MKTTSLIKYWLLLAMLVMMGACSVDEDTVIVPKTLEQYKLEFETFVRSQINVVDTTVVGFNIGNFRSNTHFEPYRTAYRSRLVAALDVLNRPNLTIADIARGYTMFAAEGRLFQTEIFISDRRPLNDLILICEALDAATPDGTAPGHVNPADRVPFTNAITHARARRSAAGVIQRQVTEEVDRLNAAKTAFENAIIK